MSFHISTLLQQMQGQIDLGTARVGLFRATVSEVDTTGRLVRLIRDGSTVAELEWRPVITGALPVVGARVNCLPYHAPGGQTPVISVIGTGAEGASALADGSVTTAKLADSSVTGIKMLNSEVTSSKIAAGNVVFAHLAGDSTVANRSYGESISTGTSTTSTTTYLQLISIIPASPGGTFNALVIADFEGMHTAANGQIRAYVEIGASIGSSDFYAMAPTVNTYKGVSVVSSFTGISGAVTTTLYARCSTAGTLTASNPRLMVLFRRTS